ncbi:MAG TPA: hypothetical protein VJ063_06200, partial [Verrucomicrobiae bacterium]|nr:hypothetical protein [Verrucomicrobiae bacterium]
MVSSICVHCYSISFVKRQGAPNANDIRAYRYQRVPVRKKGQPTHRLYVPLKNGDLLPGNQI